MLLVIIGLVILAVGFLVSWRMNNMESLSLGATIFLLLCIFGMFVPLNGYDEVNVQEYELISLNEGMNLYVIKDEKGGFICNHAVEEQKEGTHLRYHTGAEGVIFTKEGEKPVLVKYEQKAKKSIWTMALGPSIKSNIFYIPESGYRDTQKGHVN